MLTEGFNMKEKMLVALHASNLLVLLYIGIPLPQ